MSTTASSPTRNGSVVPNVTMRTVTVKGLLRNRGRFALTAVAVAMSVAFFASVLLLTTSLRGTAERDIAAANAGIESVIRGREFDGELDGGPGTQTPRYELRTDTLDQAAAAAPDATLVGISSTPATLTTSDGDIIVASGLRTRVETWVTDPALNTHHLVDGRPPQDPTEVVIERRLASAEGLAIGDSLGVATDRAAITATVTGIADFAAVAGSPTSALVFVSHDTNLLDPALLNRIVVAFDDSAASTADIETALADDAQTIVTGGADYVTELQRDAIQQTSFISTFLTFFAVIALIAGTTIIYNTFVISVAQRTKEIAMLRSIGARRSQILRSVLGEAALIGVIASTLGVAAGLVLYRGMVALFRAIGLSFLSTSPTYSLTSLMIPFAIGVAVTILSALMPARRAASVAPMEALRDQAVDSSRESRTRSIASYLLLAVTVTVAVAAFATGSGTYGLTATGAGLLALIVAGPLLVTFTSKTLGWLAARIGGEPGRIAKVNLSRNPRRSASTSFSLSLGLGLMVMFTAIAASFSGGVADDIEAGLNADTVLTPVATGGPGGTTLALPDDLVTAVADTQGVVASTSLDLATGSVDDKPNLIGLVDPASFAELYDADTTAGSIAELSDGDIAVSEAAELSIGDTVTVAFTDGDTATLTVSAVFTRAIPTPDESPQYIIDRATAPDLDTTTVTVLATTDQTTSTNDTLEAAARQAGAVQVLTKTEYVDSVSSGSNDFRNFVYALLGVALLISLVGIANTSMMSINERRREIGVMRAIGTTAQQVRSIIRVESVLLAVHGCLLGIGLGLGAAASLIALLGGNEGLNLLIPWQSMAILAVSGVIAGAAASAWPAWKGSRADMLDAIASE